MFICICAYLLSWIFNADMKPHAVSNCQLSIISIPIHILLKTILIANITTPKLELLECWQTTLLCLKEQTMPLTSLSISIFVSDRIWSWLLKSCQKRIAHIYTQTILSHQMGRAKQKGSSSMCAQQRLKTACDCAGCSVLVGRTNSMTLFAWCSPNNSKRLGLHGEDTCGTAGYPWQCYPVLTKGSHITN